MKNSKNVGIILVVLGLLLTCAVCPLALNNILVMATSGGRPQDIFSLYGKIFPTTPLYGTVFLSTVVITVQESCATVLAIVTLVVGAMVLMQTREPSKKKKSN